MNDYRFVLMPYTGRHTRTECPQCGKKEFAPYIDTHTQAIVAPAVGRCNRESSCGYHLTPKEWFALHPSTPDYAPKPQRCCSALPTAKRVDFIDPTVVQQTTDRTLKEKGVSDFAVWVALQFDKHTVERTVWRQLVRDYCLGSTSDRGTIFWQIDQQGRARTGQILYHRTTDNYADCKRSHDRHPDWVHSRMMRTGKLPKDFSMVQCLFGEHLLTKYPDKVVALVEGQKNAVIGAGSISEWVWVATVGKSGLTAERLRPLKGRKVIVFADLDAHELWNEKIALISKEIGFEYSMYNIMTQQATQADREAGKDIADYLLGKFTNQQLER